MIKTIHFKDSEYPQFQSVGFASKFAFPFALEVCKGVGLDIGCGKLEWCLPGAIPVDINLSDKNVVDSFKHEAYKLPKRYTYSATQIKKHNPTYHHPEDGREITTYDYIFSSHCLEHLSDWVAALEYWTEALKSGGVLFLYLPDFSQTYWRPWHNRKHIHSFTPELLTAWFKDNGYIKVFCSGIDLNNSFMIMGEKA